jgi:hypothetical protein
LSILESSENVEIDDDFLFTHCPNVVNATRRIADWVS